MSQNPPDFDPLDNIPLPPLPPKFGSFAYYLGSDFPQRLPQLQGKVDLLVVSPPEEVSILSLLLRVCALRKCGRCPQTRHALSGVLFVEASAVSVDSDHGMSDKVRMWYGWERAMKGDHCPLALVNWSPIPVVGGESPTRTRLYGSHLEDIETD